MDKICPQCGHRSCEEQPRFCSECGCRMDKTTGASDPGTIGGDDERKNPQVAVFCSSLIPGLGQIYNGETLKGFAFLVGTMIGLFLLVLPGLFIWIYSMYDAHIIARKMNERLLGIRPMNPIIMVVFIVTAIIMGIIVIIAIVGVLISVVLSQLTPAGDADFFKMLEFSGI